jgi:hypothetical protein
VTGYQLIRALMAQGHDVVTAAIMATVEKAREHRERTERWENEGGRCG